MKDNVFIKYGYRDHRGGLEESLKTKNYIKSESFDRMIRTGNYAYYGYDSRCHQLLWLHKNSGTWLFIEVIVSE